MSGELARMCSSVSVRFYDDAAIPLVASRVLVVLAGMCERTTDRGRRIKMVGEQLTADFAALATPTA
jgi:hypothetical protein